MIDHTPDRDLLAAYLQGSQDAFRALAERYVGLIYAIAKRQAPVHLAEDITQAVFLLLAQRAHTLRDPKLLPAWLLKVTRYCAANARRADQCRRHHEHKAAAMATSFTTDPSPDPLAQHLDAALASLSAADRTAILLRFYNNQSLAEVALSLNTTEEAAKKRVARALERLRKIFRRNNVTLSAALIAGTFANHATAAPPALAAKIAAAALAKSTATSAAALIAKGALKLMTYTTAKWTAAAAVGILLISAGTAQLVRRRNAPPAAPIAVAAPAQVPPPISPPAPLPPLVRQSISPTITILDMATHQPLAGVQIEISPGWQGGPSLFGTTGPDGTVTLPVPPSTVDTLQITARKNGFVPADTSVDCFFPDDTFPAKMSLQLEKATTIGGKVIDDHGTPLAGALVDVIVFKQYKDNIQNIPWDLRATTNAQGEWSLNNIPAQCDAIRVDAFHTSCISPGILYGAETSIPALRNRTAVTTLIRGPLIHALVRGTDGKPRKAWIGIGDQRIAANAVPEFSTSDDGQFDFVPQPGKPFYLVVRADGCASQVVEYTATDPQPVLITLQPPTPLNVRILDADGDPIPNASLALGYYKSRDGRYIRGINKTFVSDHDGRISWPESFNEQFFVTVSAYGYLTQTDTPVIPGQTNDITMRRRFLLHVTVVDDDTHQPPSAFRVVEGLFDPPKPHSRHPKLRYSDFPGWEQSHVRRTGPGTFDFIDSEQHDRFVVRILGGDYDPADSAPILPTVGDQSITIHVHKGERVAGTLVTPDGDPLKHVPVYMTTYFFDIHEGRLNFSAAALKNDPAHFSVTDDAGNFSFSPEKAPYVLLASTPDGYALATQKQFQRTNQMTLQPWNTVNGTVLDHGAPAGAGIAISAYDVLGDNSSVGPGSNYSTTTDAAGHFTLTHVLAGDYFINASNQTQTAAAHTKLVVRSGGTATVTLDLAAPLH